LLWYLINGRFYISAVTFPFSAAYEVTYTTGPSTLGH